MKRELNTKTSADKKKCAILLFLVVCLSLLAGCRNVDSAESSEDSFIVQPVVITESDDAGKDITAIDSSDASDSADNQTTPSNDQTTPSNDQTTPSNGQTTPSVNQTISSDDQTILTESYPPGNEASDNKKVKEGVNSGEGGQNKYTIDGFAFADGMEKPVCVTLSIENIQRGEEAYKTLQEYNSEIIPPNENEEYIIATFSVSYDNGEIEELYMIENRASLEQAGLYFALSNGQSNANDVTSYLSNSIYDITLAKGQNAQGAVAFLYNRKLREYGRGTPTRIVSQFLQSWPPGQLFLTGKRQ